MKIVVAIPHSHSFFWTQTCVAALMRNPPRLDAPAGTYSVKIVVVDNSPWSPAIRGIADTRLGDCVEVVPNHKNNKFHASALDCVVENFEFDYLMALETDVLVLRPGWLQWFVDLMRPTDYAVGAWHHEQFVNPSCTLYRGDVLREMAAWCRDRPEPDVLRWGPAFGKSQPIEARDPARDYADWFDQNVSWIAGPFADKRGWPAGTELRERPSGQEKGPGWWEPGQMLHHWSVEAGRTYTVCPTLTTKRPGDGVPLQTMYGGWGRDEPAVYPSAGRMAAGPVLHDHGRQLEAVELFGNAEAAHLWGGTRALDVIKHDVTCQFVRGNTPTWLAREARFWRQVVPPDVQAATLDLIRKWGWHYRGQGTPEVTDRDRAAVEFVRGCYEAGGVAW